MKYLRNQQGIISILSVTFFSILVMIIAIGTILAQNKELRQSTDADQSIRSYYAAESGVEEALFTLTTQGSAYRAPNCTGNNNLNLPSLSSDLTITCAKIADFNIAKSGSLKQEEAIQESIVPNAGANQMILAWNGKDASYDYTGTYDAALYSSGVVLPAQGTWNMPAMMEVTVYAYPNKNVQPNEVLAKTIYLRPSARGSSSADFGTNDRIQPILCHPGNFDKACSATIGGFPKLSDGTGRTYNYVVRFRPRYHGASFAAQYVNFNGVGNSGIKIDVTAKAGNISRRIVATTFGNGQTVAEGLDYVIFTQLDICKDIKLDSTTGKVKPGSLYGTGPNCQDDEDGIGDDNPDVD